MQLYEPLSEEEEEEEQQQQQTAEKEKSKPAAHRFSCTIDCSDESPDQNQKSIRVKTANEKLAHRLENLERIDLSRQSRCTKLFAGTSPIDASATAALLNENFREQWPEGYCSEETKETPKDTGGLAFVLPYFPGKVHITSGWHRKIELRPSFPEHGADSESIAIDHVANETDTSFLNENHVCVQLARLLTPDDIRELFVHESVQNFALLSEVLETSLELQKLWREIGGTHCRYLRYEIRARPSGPLPNFFFECSRV